MGTINMFQLPCSPLKNFYLLVFPPYPILFSLLPQSSLSTFLSCPPVILLPSALLPQAEQASLSHVVDLLSLILLTAIWAVCPRDSLAVLGHWVQEKLSQVRPSPFLLIMLKKQQHFHLK